MPSERGKGRGFGARVGFIALGDIGLPMATSLIESDFDVTVYDLRSEPVEAAVRLGAKAAGSVREIAQACTFIHLALDNEHQLATVFHGPDGIFANAAKGTVLLVHSTVPPKAVQEFGAEAESHGLQLLDSPMSGANIAAQNGTLTFIVGGEVDLLNLCRPLLEAMGSTIFHLGPLGNWQVGKLVNGLMFHIGYVATLEALRLSRAYDVPEETMIAVARVSTGDSWMVQHWGYMEKLLREHTKAGTDTLIYRHIRKDIVDALIAADAAHTAMPLAAAAYQIYPDLLIERLVVPQQARDDNAGRIEQAR
jgi:3-hydroxyisobutyrate dehydrogenase